MLRGDQDKATNYMKVAVELDAKNYKQLQKDPIFMPIRKEVPKPEIIEKKEVEEVNKETDEEIKQLHQEKKNQKQSQKEKKVFQHLFKTNILIENLSNEDLTAIRNRRKKEKLQEKEQKEQEQD